jgi:hypothetical protein
MFEQITDFTADRFAPTKWEKADRKVRFAQQFIRFVESDFDQRQFPHWFYVRLALCFGHIAHYNRAGFFETFFTTTQDKVRFLWATLRHQPCGDPGYTFSDVERALQSWLSQNAILGKFEQKLADEEEAAELAELDRLQKKHGSKT